MNTKILVVDDEKIQREMLGGYLEKKGNEVLLASSGPEAIEIINARTIDIMISDQKMPEMSGLELAGIVREEHPNISTVILTAFGSVDDAVQAMKNGVEDYITKPVNLDELDMIITRIREKRQLVRENELLREQVRKAPDIPEIVYISEDMEGLMSKVARAAESRATVLITGESGTGKELVARAIHEISNRKEMPFVAVNFSAVPENLIESELFGHEKGAFTGADRLRIGRFEQADGGTLFLDEIGEVPLAIQVKLLRVLQEKKFEHVGGNESITVDVRIVAATNSNLEQEIQEGTFREDLYYRLNVVGLEIPPLRKRKADIPVLTEHFIKHYAVEHGKKIHSITPEALDHLVKYSFPGNIRELSNIIEQAIVLSRNETLTVRDLPLRLSPGEEISDESTGLEQQVANLEREHLRKAMKESRGNKSAAARLLGISERKIRYMLKKYGGD